MIHLLPTVNNITYKLRRFALIIIATISLVGIAVQDASAASGSLGGRPANPKESNNRSRSIFVHTIDFGQSATEGVLIVNNSDTRQTAKIYAVDATVTSSGSLTCRQRVEAKKDVGSWIAISQTFVTLDPGKDQVVPFTIAVPKDGVDVGEHNGCIVIEPDVDEDSASEASGVRIRTRSAIRVAVTVPGDLRKNLEFVNFDVRSDKGNYHYDVGVKNTGNVSLDTDIKVRLSSVFGRLVFENGGQYPVIPKAQLDLSFVDEKPPLLGGWYWAESSISYDGTVSNELGAQTNKQIIVKNWDRQMVFIPPTVNGMIIILGALGLIAGVPLYFVHRMFDRKKALRRGKEHIVNPGETLKSIAEHYGVTWKKLATLNKIKPPYDIELGSSLVVPQKPAKKEKNKSKKQG